MKMLFDETMELITPCFCAGADQSKAEIRAPSIRGELRWWFRALGGTQKEEQEIFGGIAGEEGTSSAIVVRVSDVRPSPKRVSLPEKLNNTPDDLFYLLYYAHASGEGIRYEEEGYLSPETRFKIQILQRKKVDLSKFHLAYEAFYRLGSIGLRSNRACGAFYATEKVQSFSAFKEWIKGLPQEIQIAWQQNGANPKFCSNWKSVMQAESAILKLIRSDGYSAGKQGNIPTPLGLSQPRQGSAVRLRPVQLKEGILPVVIYAPKVLGANSTDLSFSLDGFKFLHGVAN